MISFHKGFFVLLICILASSLVESTTYNCRVNSQGNHELELNLDGFEIKVLSKRKCVIEHDDDIISYNDEEICEYSLDSPEYQKSEDGTFWYTDCDIGERLTKDEIRRFKRGILENPSRQRNRKGKQSNDDKNACDEKNSKAQSDEGNQKSKVSGGIVDENTRRQREIERRLWEQEMMREKRLAEAEERRDEAAIEREKNFRAAERERETRLSEAEIMRDKNSIERTNRLWEAEKEREANLRQAEIEREKRAKERLMEFKQAALKYKEQPQQGTPCQTSIKDEPKKEITAQAPENSKKRAPRRTPSQRRNRKQ